MAGLLANVVTGCGGEAFDSIRSGNSNTDRVRSYASWEELVKEATEVGEDSIDVAVVGEVTGVEEGRSSTWDMESGREERTVLQFGDSRAMSSTYHMNVEVSALVGENDVGVTRGSVVRVGIAVDPEVTLSDVEADFGAIDGAVFFLVDSAVYDYEKDLFGIAEDGSLVASAGVDGDLSFPMLPGSDPIQPPDGVEVADLMGG